MKPCGTFWILEIKRAWKRAGRLLFGALLLLFLACTAGFLFGKLLYGDAVSRRIQIGAVVPEGDAFAKQVLSMITSLDSVKSLCDFHYMEREDAINELEAGNLFAVMEIPEGMVEGIMDGSNIPIRVIFPENSGTESLIFKELTDAGAKTLGAAQAGIYAGDELIRTAGEAVGISEEARREAVSALERDLNEIFLSYSLPREDYFFSQEVTATGEVGLAAYYGISMFVLALLLLAIPAADFLLPWGRAMKQQLSRTGIGPSARCAGRILGLGSLYMAVVGLSWAAYCLWAGRPFPADFGDFGRAAGGMQAGPLAVFSSFGGSAVFSAAAALLLFLLFCWTAAAFAVFLFEFAGTLLGGVMLLFLAGIGQHILAGGFLPVIFLPEALRKAAPYMPSAVWMDTAKVLLTGAWDWGVLVRFFFLGVILFGGCRLMEVRNR